MYPTCSSRGFCAHCVSPLRCNTSCGGGGVQMLRLPMCLRRRKETCCYLITIICFFPPLMNSYLPFRPFITDFIKLRLLFYVFCLFQAAVEKLTWKDRVAGYCISVSSILFMVGNQRQGLASPFCSAGCQLNYYFPCSVFSLA